MTSMSASARETLPPKPASNRLPHALRWVGLAALVATAGAACDDAGSDAAGGDGLATADAVGDAPDSAGNEGPDGDEGLDGSGSESPDASDGGPVDTDGSQSTVDGGTDADTEGTDTLEDADGGEAGGDAGNEGADTTEPEPAPECAPVGPLAVHGRVYADLDGSDASRSAMWFDPASDAPLEGVTVNIVGADGVSATTCADGSYSTEELAPGAYIAVPDLAPELGCASRNCTRRFPEAVQSGNVVILTIGDSIPVIGAKDRFPARLALLLAKLAEVDDRNVAVPGTTSKNWLPGTFNFEKEVLPNLPDADVVLISLGGNDILDYLNNPALLNDLPAAVEGAKQLVTGIVENVLEIAAAIREADPDVDIVYCLYPDYSQAVATFPWSLVGPLIGAETLGEVLEIARAGVPTDGTVLLADMYEAAKGLPLDSYMADQLHFNGLGHTLYAEVIFETLGGVFIGNSPLLDSPTTPLGLEQRFSTTAE
jgi:lysophospholipase L1-like esterase